MEIKIGERLLTGTPEEILREFQNANFHADLFESLDEYIEHMSGYCEQVTEQPCPLPRNGTPNETSKALLRWFAVLGAVEILEGADEE